MELALITAQQVAVLFLLIGTGMVAVKSGVLKLENKQALSNLLVYIIVPAMVVNSYRMEFSAQILRNLLAAFGMSVLSVLLGPHRDRRQPHRPPARPRAGRQRQH